MSDILAHLSRDECPKCGQPFSSEPGERVRVHYVNHHVGQDSDWIACGCPRCGYEWNERPMDRRGA